MSKKIKIQIEMTEAGEITDISVPGRDVEKKKAEIPFVNGPINEVNCVESINILTSIKPNPGGYCCIIHNGILYCFKC